MFTLYFYSIALVWYFHKHKREYKLSRFLLLNLKHDAFSQILHSHSRLKLQHSFLSDVVCVYSLLQNRDFLFQNADEYIFSKLSSWKQEIFDVISDRKCKDKTSPSQSIKMEVFRNYYNLIESFWITREKVEEDFLTNNEIEAIREIEDLLEAIKEIIFEQDEDDANMRRFILNQFNHLMYLIKEVVDESDNNINIMF